MADQSYTSDNSSYVSGNSTYGNRQYGNAVYGNHYYGNGAYGNQQYNQQYNPYYNNYNDPNQNDEERSNFNIMEWVFRIIHYWYLFVIGVAIAYGVAYLMNRRWVPQQYSQATIILKEQANYSGMNIELMRGFGLEQGYNNISNQLIMLGSYDIMSRVIDSLPFFRTEYIAKGRFKTRNLFRATPFTIETTRINPRAYNQLFEVNFQKDGTIHIQSTNEDMPLDIITRYGEPIECALFSGTIWPTELMINNGTVCFRFRDREGLINEFRGRLQMDFIASSSTVLALALVSDCPERDCEFLDKLSEIFVMKNLESKNEVAARSIKFINEQLSGLMSDLEVSETAITNFRQENKFLDVSTYAGQLMGKISSYDGETMKLRLKETYFDYLTNYLNTNIESGAIIAPASLGVTDPMLTQLVGQLNDLRLQRGELTEKNVYYAKYTKDMENVKEAITEVISSMRASLEIERQDLATRYQEVEEQIQGLPEKELQMVSIERKYRIDDNYYTFFLQKRAEAEIQRASNVSDNKILDRAMTTAIMNANTKRNTTTTAIAIGLLIPLGIIVLSELLNNKVRTPREAVSISPYHLLGTLRHAKSQNPTLVKDHPRSSYAEMLRSIRTRLEFIVKRKDKIMLTITSTESGDGKTFLSTNIATLYATSKRKTILIDMDIRKPNIHTKLGLPKGLGITDYLIDQCELEDIIQRDTPFGFDFIRAGTVPPNPGELMHSDKLMNLLKLMKEQYDYVIIDTSPVGLVPDAYTVIEQTDVCLFVIRCLRTEKAFCRETLELLSEIIETPEKVQLILSDIPNEGYHGGYRYGSGYGYGYGVGNGYGYGYGYGGTKKSKKHKYRYGKYGKYYAKYFGKENAAQNSSYYEDDDEV